MSPQRRGQRRRTFLKTGGAVLTAGVGALAGCSDGGSGGGGSAESGGSSSGGSGDGGSGSSSGGTTGSGGNDLPVIRYAGIPKTQLNDLMLLFHQSSHMRENVMPNVGEKYDVKVVTVKGTPLVVNTLGAGEADAGILAYSSFANAISGNVISGGASVLAPLTYDGPRYADTYCATADSDIGGIGDLAGMSLAVNAIGSAIDIAARIALKKNDVDPGQVDFREASFGAIPSTLNEGKVDVGTFIQPFYQMNEDKLQVVFDDTEAFGSFLKIFLTARNDFLDANGEAIGYWMEDFWEGINWWRNDDNADKRLQIATDVIGLPNGLLEQLVQTDQGYYHGEDGLGIDAEWLQKPIDGMAQTEYLGSSLDMSKYIDSSYLPSEANTKPDIGSMG